MSIKNNLFPGRHVDNYMHSIRAMSLTKNKKWIENMVMAGNICINEGTWSNEWAMDYLFQMNQIIDALEVAHPGNWDMHIEKFSPASIDNSGKRRVFELHPVILYPAVKIENSRDESRDIKDLLVKIPLKRNTDFEAFNFAVRIVQGTRLHYTYEDFTYNYVHSHLETWSQRGWEDNLAMRSFCIGSDTEIGEIMLEMEGNGFEEGLFGLYLTMVDTLVHWESVEGGPHCYMRDVVNAQKENQVSHSQGDLGHYYEYFRRNITSFDANFVFNKGRYQIKIDKKLNEFVRNWLMNYRSGEFVEALLVKEKEGAFYSPKNMSVETPEQLLSDAGRSGQLPYVFVQGRKVTLRVAPHRTEEEVNINEYNVYPKFLNYVTKQLEQEYYDKAVRSSVIRTQAELSHA